MLQSCTPANSLKTEAAESRELQGTYSLILYGGNFGDDLETVALLDREDDRYTIEPYAPEFKYRVKRGMSAASAQKEAEDFVGLHSSFIRGQLRSIRDRAGAAVGYELRPLYLPLTYGTDDVLDIDYVIKDSKVIVKIKLKPFLEKMEMDFRRQDG